MAVAERAWEGCFRERVEDKVEEEARVEGAGVAISGCKNNKQWTEGSVNAQWRKRSNFSYCAWQLATLTAEQS